jgi:high-affinity Fe2+/Pb2+ permease
VTDPSTDTVAGDPSRDPFENPVARVPGGYRTLVYLLALAGVVSVVHLAQRWAWIRVAALLFVAAGARTLWARLRLPDGLGAAFSPNRATETTLLCAALAGYGAVRSSLLVGVLAAAVVLLGSWATSPRGPFAAR